MPCIFEQFGNFEEGCPPPITGRSEAEGVKTIDVAGYVTDEKFRKWQKGMQTKNIILTKRYESPCGVLLLGSFGNKLCLCDWQVEKHSDRVNRRLESILHAEFKEGTSEVIEQAERQLDEFFAGGRKAFTVPLLFVGTDFQKTVWNELLKIPFGQTISYGEMAQRIGMSKAVRAVANANGANAMSIFVPCHRVVGSDHSLTGYGGGLNAKRRLLALEGCKECDKQGQ